MNREELLKKFAEIRDLINSGMLHATTTEELYTVLTNIDASVSEVFEVESYVSTVYEE